MFTPRDSGRHLPSVGGPIALWKRYASRFSNGDGQPSSENSGAKGRRDIVSRFSKLRHRGITHGSWLSRRPFPHRTVHDPSPSISQHDTSTTSQDSLLSTIPVIPPISPLQALILPGRAQSESPMDSVVMHPPTPESSSSLDRAHLTADAYVRPAAPIPINHVPARNHPEVQSPRRMRPNQNGRSASPKSQGSHRSRDSSRRHPGSTLPQPIRQMQKNTESSPPRMPSPTRSTPGSSTEPTIIAADPAHPQPLPYFAYTSESSSQLSSCLDPEPSPESQQDSISYTWKKFSELPWVSSGRITVSYRPGLARGGGRVVEVSSNGRKKKKVVVKSQNKSWYPKQVVPHVGSSTKERVWYSDSRSDDAKKSRECVHFRSQNVDTGSQTNADSQGINFPMSGPKSDGTALGSSSSQGTSDSRQPEIPSTTIIGPNAKRQAPHSLQSRSRGHAVLARELTPTLRRNRKLSTTIHSLAKPPPMQTAIFPERMKREWSLIDRQNLVTPRQRKPPGTIYPVGFFPYTPPLSPFHTSDFPSSPIAPSNSTPSPLYIFNSPLTLTPATVLHGNND